MKNKFYKQHYCLRIVIGYLNQTKEFIKNKKSIDKSVLLQYNENTPELNDSKHSIKEKSIKNILINASKNIRSIDYYVHTLKIRNYIISYEQAINKKENCENIQKLLIDKINKLVEYYNN